MEEHQKTGHRKLLFAIKSPNFLREILGILLPVIVEDVVHFKMVEKKEDLVISLLKRALQIVIPVMQPRSMAYFFCHFLKKHTMEKSLTKELFINSPVFRNNDFIPSKYTCEGENINPPLDISGIPEEAETLALIVEDPDAPKGIFDHWIVWNIPKAKTIAENSVPGIQGKNSFGKNQYNGPCPPSGTHRYYFKLYALDTILELQEGSDKIALLEAMKGHILTVNELIGLYKKNA